MQTTQKQVINDLVIINGGVEVTVTHLDDTEETIKVRQVPLRHMSEYGNAQGDEGKIIEIVTNKPAEWVDSLTQESQELLIETGEQLNLDPFYRWTKRRLTANNRLEPLNNLLSGSGKSVPPSSTAAVTPPSNSAS